MALDVRHMALDVRHMALGLKFKYNVLVMNCDHFIQKKIVPL
jgi:hypothetical protein